jgi:hypothetical protein
VASFFGTNELKSCQTVKKVSLVIFVSLSGDEIYYLRLFLTSVTGATDCKANNHEKYFSY